VSGLEFAASLVRSLAWPVAALAAVVILRGPLAEMLHRGVHRVRAGPLEVEFKEELAEVRKELERSPELRDTTVEGGEGVLLPDDLLRLAELSPRAAILEAFARVEERIRQILPDGGPEVKLRGGAALARVAHQRGLISDETLNAVEGLAVLRNLAAHGRDEGVDTTRALDYVALAEAVLFALRTDAARRG
jgi:hypothetical protein